MGFEPDFYQMVNVLNNRRPARLPLYEHIISPEIMQKILGDEFASLVEGDASDIKEFFSQYCRFFQEMTYDTVSFEVCIVEILPEHGAIGGGRPGPIQSRDDFNKYPWDELPQRYWNLAAKQFETLARCLPNGMKAIGGIGNGVLEISEDLVGLQYLAYMMADDPELFADLYRKIGDLMYELWSIFLSRYTGAYVACRFGDDLGFMNNTLLSPETIREHIIPQYRRVIELILNYGRPFLWHSCGKIFSVMEDMIELGISAKHSNEDNIAPFDKWISLYGDRIALLGGFDLNFLCTKPQNEIFAGVVEMGQKFRQQARGYALGSGNSIPDYLPVESYLAMVGAAQQIRRNELDSD
jgi:uroporphyrinogen decarboxylase